MIGAKDILPKISATYTCQVLTRGVLQSLDAVVMFTNLASLCVATHALGIFHFKQEVRIVNYDPTGNEDSLKIG
jgi:hypothetical protein